MIEDEALQDLEGAYETVERVTVWPDHRQALRVFATCMGQWRCGPGGLIGLDYAVVCAVLDRMGVRRRAQLRVLEQVGVMERQLVEWVASRQRALVQHAIH
ncbi:MAG: DUF1799 domain-containing protein [Burkholderiales bacterium]|nr:DUF1799 domain-containing protein [Burkholderiales bacterium]